MLEISLVPDYSRRLAVYLTLPVSALWLTYTCHIGLGGSSRSANGSVRLTLDISHSPCQWEVYFVFVYFLVCSLVRYKTSYPRPIPGTPPGSSPCTCSECGPGAHSRHKVHPHLPPTLSPGPHRGSNTRSPPSFTLGLSLSVSPPSPWRLPGRLVHPTSLLTPPHTSVQNPRPLVPVPPRFPLYHCPLRLSHGP